LVPYFNKECGSGTVSGQVTLNGTALNSNTILKWTGLVHPQNQKSRLKGGRFPK